MAKHRAPEPQPGDPGWTHPHVKGETDPHKIKAQLDAIDADIKAQLDAIDADINRILRMKQNGDQS